MKTLSKETWRGLEAIARLVREHGRFLIATHVNPDGDAVGSLLGLGRTLEGLGKQVRMYSRGPIPEMYAFLPGTRRVTRDPGRGDDYDVVFLLDCNELERAGRPVEPVNGAPVLAVLDHHEFEGSLPEYTVVDTNASAAGELVYHLLTVLGADLTPDIAQNLFTAISTDTGSFAFDNTSAMALEVCSALVKAGARPWDIFRQLHYNRSARRLELLGAALAGLELFHEGRLAALTITLEMMERTGTSGPDTDGFVEYPRSVKGVDLAVLFRQEDDGSCHVSLRSLGRVNAAALARSFGGGGHEKAAGFTTRGAIEQIKTLLVQAAQAALPGDAPAERSA
ncbi:MAG: bifunctional oligoribonuclease/PAP phosphatase NrnA [Proteobacteria bacterium]|nr:bifunctional oligoribonuclease/PAP phosphatase NrnA [Pseudomonadota bacterium]